MIILEQTTEKQSFTFTPRALSKGNILTFENLATNQIQTVNDAEFYINDYYVFVDISSFGLQLLNYYFCDSFFLRL